MKQESVISDPWLDDSAYDVCAEELPTPEEELQDLIKSLEIPREDMDPSGVLLGGTPTRHEMDYYHSKSSSILSSPKTGSLLYNS